MEDNLYGCYFELGEKGSVKINTEDVARLSPLKRKHFNFLGKYSFNIPDYINHGKLRSLNIK